MIWRSGRDSNSRDPLRGQPAFQAGGINHSPTAPRSKARHAPLRKNKPAEAGCMWRSRSDSNGRHPVRCSALAGHRFQPLTHVTVDSIRLGAKVSNLAPPDPEPGVLPAELAPSRILLPIYTYPGCFITRSFSFGQARKSNKLADRVGFEPTVESPPLRFSGPLP
jgi:hypothetical protein